MSVFWNVHVHVERGRWVWGFAGTDPWVRDALAVAARAAGGEDGERSEDLVSTIDHMAEEIARTLASPPARAPEDLSALGMYTGTLRVTEA
jgi:hypothetical protein